jgi:replicative DNA helicase
MLRSESIEEIMDIIRPESFYSEKHRLIFRAMTDLFSKNEPIDLLTLSSRLKERELLDQTGGMSYLTELVNAVPSSANAEYYAQMIQKKHLMGRAILAARRGKGRTELSA